MHFCICLLVRGQQKALWASPAALFAGSGGSSAETCNGWLWATCLGVTSVVVGPLRALGSWQLPEDTGCWDHPSCLSCLAKKLLWRWKFLWLRNESSMLKEERNTCVFCTCFATATPNFPNIFNFYCRRKTIRREPPPKKIFILTLLNWVAPF